MASLSALKLYADAGYHLTPLEGKKPVRPGWPKAPYLVDPMPEDFPENFGVVLQETDLVVDCDPRNYKNGKNSFQELQNFLKWTLKETQTPVVQTGGGGLHIYLKIPAGLKLRKELKEYPGVEFKTKGAQVVGAGSIHPDTKKEYVLINGLFAPGKTPQAPKALLDLVTRREKLPLPMVEALPLAVTDDDQSKMRFVEYCRDAAPAEEGHGGDKLTFSVACFGRDLGLLEKSTLEIMKNHYNPRCTPPWGPNELAGKVTNAYKYAQSQAGHLSPAADFPVVEVQSEDDKLRWDRNEAGTPKKTLNNCVNYFLSPKVGLSTLVAWDEFTDQVMIVEAPPWFPKGVKIPKDGLPWTDEDTIKCRYFLSSMQRFDVNTDLVFSAVVIAACARPNHPVRNFLNGLVWDEKPRLDKWLTTYCGVDPTLYTQEVGVKTLLGAVGRVFRPGVKFDYMLVLEGDQGTGKSSVVAILGGPWYGDIVINPHDKDTVAAMRGKWIIEASEMDFTTKAEAQAQKAFISRQTDTVRAAYARLSKDVRRQCIFMGTMNVEAGMGYLKDMTGNRRFWPVKTTDINLPALRDDREQLFAEAVVRYKAGESLYLDDIVAEAMAVKEQKARRQVDPWTDKIEEWLEHDQFDSQRNIVTTMEIWVDCLQGLEKQLDRRTQMRIAHVMRDELKWFQGVTWSPGHRKHVKGYRRPSYDPRARQEALLATA